MGYATVEYSKFFCESATTISVMGITEIKPSLDCEIVQVGFNSGVIWVKYHFKFIFFYF